MIEQGKLPVVACLFLYQFGFGLNPAVAADVVDGRPALAENPAYQQAAMADGGILFAAEQRHPVRAKPFLQSRQASRNSGDSATRP